MGSEMCIRDSAWGVLAILYVRPGIFLGRSYKASFISLVLGFILFIVIIWTKMAQLGLEESSEVKGFRRPNQAQIEAEISI